MAGRRLPGIDVRVRRGQRADRLTVHALLGEAGLPLEPKVMRRIVDDVGNDFYLAEDAFGQPVGLVAISYARLLSRGGSVAFLDTVVTRGGPDGLVPALIAFAEDRARKRGCRQLMALGAADVPAVRAVLVARGYGSREGMVRCLQEGGR